MIFSGDSETKRRVHYHFLRSHRFHKILCDLQNKFVQLRTLALISTIDYHVINYPNVSFN